MENRICKLLNIKIPIIQAGMIWCSGWKLASAVSQAGGLGVLGSGSMYPDDLREQIQKVKDSTSNPFGVNIPLLYPNVEDHINSCIDLKVPVVITSAGNPKTWTEKLKSHGIKVIHVVSSSTFAQKAEVAGVDAIVAEGFEAGGHNGREETTTMCLIPKVAKSIQIPLIAAGGIGCGRSMLAAIALGADAVQIGSRFVCTEESSAHINFKQRVSQAIEGDTKLMLKQLTPVRLLKNDFYIQVEQAESSCATKDALQELLGRGRAKKGMFEGDLKDGELEIGQVSANFDDIIPAGVLLQQIFDEYNQVKKML